MKFLKVLILLVSSLSFFHACKRANTAQVIENEPCADGFVKTLADTLFTSEQAEFGWFPEHDAYFVQKIRLPRGAWGIAANPGFFIATFQCDTAGNWRQNSCEAYPSAGFSFVSRRADLNFDSFADFWIDGSDGGAHGNHFSLVFTYDSALQTFKRDTILELENLEVDPEKQLLRSQHFSSICGANIKEIYGWKNDSLVLLGSARIHGCVTDSSELKWDDFTNGTSKTLKTTREKGWEIFEKLFWKTE